MNNPSLNSGTERDEPTQYYSAGGLYHSDIVVKVEDHLKALRQCRLDAIELAADIAEGYEKTCMDSSCCAGAIVEAIRNLGREHGK